MFFFVMLILVFEDRLRTIISYDRILVLDAGTIAVSRLVHVEIVLSKCN